jgi:hypothetical protein
MSSFNSTDGGKYFIDRNDNGTKDGTCTTSTTDECLAGPYGNYAEGDLKGTYTQLSPADAAMVKPLTRAPVDFAAGLKDYGSATALFQQVDATIAGVMRDCAECHAGGGAMEYIPMAPGTDLVAATVGGTRQDVRSFTNPATEYNAYSYFIDQYDEDGDGVKGEVLRADYDNSGVLEVDCLMCHMDGYSWHERTEMLREGKLDTSRVVGAGLGEDAYSGAPMGTDYGKTVEYHVGSADPLEVYPWGSWNLLKFSSIGKDAIKATPPDANCTSCHFDMHQVDWKKRGTSWANNHDNEVHSALGCMGCHRRKDGVKMDGGDGSWTGKADANLGHDPAKGNAPFSSAWNKTDNTVKTCKNCHIDQIADNFNAVDPTAVHEALGLLSVIGQDGRDGIRDANHLDFIACEACHTRKLGHGPVDDGTGNTHGSLYEWGTGGAMVDSTGPDSEGRLTDHENLYVERTMENNMTVSWQGGKLRNKNSLITMFWRDKDDNFANGGDPAFFDVNADGQTGGMDAVNPFHLRNAMEAAGLAVLTHDGVVTDAEIDAQRAALFAYLTQDTGVLPGTTAGDEISDTNGKPFTTAAAGSTLGADWSAGKLKLSFMGAPFLANHNTSPKAYAWGAGGCTDCHGDGAGFYNGTYELKGRDLNIGWDNTSPTGENKYVVPFTKVNKANYTGRDTSTVPLGAEKADWQFTDYHPTVFAKGLKGRSIAIRVAHGGTDTLRDIDRSELIYENDSTLAGAPGARIMIDGTTAGTRTDIVTDLNSAPGVATGAHDNHVSAHMGDCVNCHYDASGAGDISDTWAVAPGVPGDFVWTAGTGGNPGTCSSNNCHVANGIPSTTEWKEPPSNGVTVQVILNTATASDNLIEFDASASVCDDEFGNPLTCMYSWNFIDGLGTVVDKYQADCSTDVTTLAEAACVVVKYDARGTYRGTLTMAETASTIHDIGSVYETTEESVAPNGSTDFTHTIDPVKRAVLSWTGMGTDIRRLEIHWDDGQRTIVVEPGTSDSATHAYVDGGTYVLKVVTLDDEHNTITYTTTEDGDLEITTL